MYGRLKQENREDLAVPALGYLLLTPGQEHIITELITGEVDEGLGQTTGDDSSSEELDGTDFWGRWEEHRGQPVRAIVKELVVEGDGPFSATQVPQLWNDLEALHKLGILVRDVHIGNYLNGKLVDFSLAWTMYHPCLHRISEYYLKKMRRKEALQLEKLIIDWWQLDDDSVELEIPEALHRVTHGDGLGADPRDYDWKKWENPIDAAKMMHEVYEDWHSDTREVC